MTEQSADGSAKKRRWITLGICSALLLLFGILSYTATCQKSATYDEPLHAVGGFLRRFYHDYRLNPEDPALFGIWASLPHSINSLKLDPHEAVLDLVLNDITRQWTFVIRTMYQTAENNAGDAFLHHSRFMFVVVGILMGITLAWWSGKIAGPVAAVTATALFALDPNFLAHSGLVKNDVMLSAVMLATMLAVWRFGQSGSVPSLLGICFGCAAAVNIKFSGMLLGPIVPLAILVRALMPEPWTVFGLKLGTRPKRILVVPAVMLLAAVVSWAGTWAVYGFRFAPVADGRLIETRQMVEESKRREFYVWQGKHPEFVGNWKSGEEMLAYINARPLSVNMRVTLWLEEKRILPQAWLYGFMYTYTTTLTRSSFLCGEKSGTGFWYYFPATMVFKTPVATLGAMLLGLVVTISAYASPKAKHLRIAGIWACTCLAMPPLIYGFAALTTNLNLGIRHILPVYPFIFIGLGITAAALFRMLRSTAMLVGAVLALMLVIESLATYPDYLPFFNFTSGGSRGGLRLLADSNLDWGQDLPALAAWQKQRKLSHPTEPLYVVYFGTANPGFYGLDYINIGSAEAGFGWLWGPMTLDVSKPGVLAVSATVLQGVYNGGDEFKKLRDKKPLDVLGGSIYLYEWPPK